MTTTKVPLRVFIVDDEPPARNRLHELLTDCHEQLPLQIVGEASNGLEALDQLTLHPADVVLIDIRMPEMDGIELAQHLQKLTPPPAIIFTTAYNDYAIKAFDIHAMDYLLKPIRLSRLFEALSRIKVSAPHHTEVFRELQTEARKHFSIHERGKIHLVPIEQVLFLRAELKYITVHTADRDFILEESLTALENEFPDRFIRIHRNCLVAKEAIESFEKGGGDEGEHSWMVKIRGYEEPLPISRRQQHIVKGMAKH